ncbi:unnamed protein product [Ilex paraguariensis]|uniref:Uncharacterized protein n=1 Tax=Ilex paraguariensis TaxID=185542 RepID=A0ABC8RN17_9AQUA
MAGANYLECSVDFEDWEHQDLEPPPPHLLAEEDEVEDEDEEENYVRRVTNVNYGSPVGNYLMDCENQSEASHSLKKHCLDDEGGNGDDDFNDSEGDGSSYWVIRFSCPIILLDVKKEDDDHENHYKDMDIPLMISGLNLFIPLITKLLITLWLCLHYSGSVVDTERGEERDVFDVVGNVVRGEKGVAHGMESEVVEDDGAKGADDDSFHRLGDGSVAGDAAGMTKELGRGMTPATRWTMPALSLTTPILRMGWASGLFWMCWALDLARCHQWPLGSFWVTPLDNFWATLGQLQADVKTGVAFGRHLGQLVLVLTGVGDD